GSPRAAFVLSGEDGSLGTAAMDEMRHSRREPGALDAIPAGACARRHRDEDRGPRSVCRTPEGEIAMSFKQTNADFVTLVGDGGFDWLSASGNYDVLIAAFGQETLIASGQHDTLLGGGGTNILLAQNSPYVAPNDTLIAGSGTTTLVSSYT